MDVDLAALLPQTGGMRLLAELVLHEPERTVCRVDPLESGLFEARAGQLPAWLALEYMAQCASVHGALVQAAGEGASGPPAGLLLGARNLELHVASLELRPLEVEARYLGGARGLFSFQCALRDPGRDSVVATGRLSVYTLPEVERQGESSVGG